MKHTEEQAIAIAKEYKGKFPELANEIKSAQFNPQFNVEGRKAWLVNGEFVLFGEVRHFWYVISDQTGKVEYTFNEHGRIDPHIETEEEKDEEWEKEWDDYYKSEYGDEYEG